MMDKCVEDIVLRMQSIVRSASKRGLDEIDLSIGHNPGAKPGIVRKFPKEKEGGNSLNLSVDDGPHEFPHAEDI